MNIYSAYIDNFLNAKDAVRIAKEARPAFMKFLEVGPGSCLHRFWPGRMGANLLPGWEFPPHTPSWFCCKEGQLG